MTSPSILTHIQHLAALCRQREEAICASTGLTPSALTCLRALPDAGTIGSRALAERMGLSPSRGSRVVDSLVRDGYASRAPDPDDRRASLLALTPAGADLQRDVHNHFRDCEHRIRENLTEDQLRSAQDSLAVLMEAFVAP